jgi:hypothetical protein
VRGGSPDVTGIFAGLEVVVLDGLDDFAELTRMRVENVMGRTDESGGGAFAFDGGASGGTDDGYSVSRFKACSAVFSTIFMMDETIVVALLRRYDVNDGV